MTPAFEESEVSGGLADSVRSRHLLRVVADAMLDPQVLLEPVRDSQGRVVDFLYVEVNRATCEYLGLSRDELLGHGLMSKSPGIAEAGLFADYVRCLDTGEPVVHDDFTYDNEILAGTRRYDIRASRATSTAISLTWRDVTERYAAAQRLAESQLNYRLLAENAGDLVVVIRDGRFVWVSPSCTDVIGGSPDYWVGHEATEIVLPEERERIAESTEVVESGGAVQMRHRVQALDGTIHWVDVHAKPFHAPDGREDGITAAMRVIDYEVAAEEVIQKARAAQTKADALYRRSMDSAAVGMCLASPEGPFLQVNNALCKFFGYDSATLLQKTWIELTAPDYLQADLDQVTELIAGRIESYRMIKQFIHADGHLLWGDLSVGCLRRADGSIEYSIGQIIDITAQLEADEWNRALSEVIQQQSDRLNSELRSAASYVSSILPGDLDDGPVRVSARYLPTQQLAGDMFDYRWIDDDHLLVYLIDVSGHGISPALLSVSVHNLLRSGSLPLPTLLAPDEVLAELNQLFQMDNQDENYLTMWCGVYELSTRTLRYASAGAPPAFAITPDATTASELSTDGQPLGMFHDAAYSSRTYTVPPGCRILIYSDGAYESALDHGHQLSVAGFNTLFTRLAASPLDDLVETLRGLTPSGTFDDDCTLVNMAFD